MDLKRRLAFTTMATLTMALVLPAATVQAQDKSIVMASTTSTDQSGLFGHLLPAFRQASGIDVRVVAVGTGQALDMARRGDADVVFVHDQVAEEKFVAEGWGLKRQAVMYNDFVLIGPAADPAKAKGGNIAEALLRVAAAKASFISRGDKSGTHAAELRLWKQAGADQLDARPQPQRHSGRLHDFFKLFSALAHSGRAQAATFFIATRSPAL